MDGWIGREEENERQTNGMNNNEHKQWLELMRMQMSIKKTNMKLLMLCAAMSQNQHLLNLDIMNMAMATTKKDQKNKFEKGKKQRTHIQSLACAL